MNIIDVAEQIRFLQELGGDTWNIEAKSAAQGYPETVDETLSSFANMPEGGLLLLGVSELDGIVEVTGVQKPTELMATLGSKARTRITPPSGWAQWNSTRSKAGRSSPVSFLPRILPYGHSAWGRTARPSSVLPTVIMS